MITLVLHLPRLLTLLVGGHRHLALENLALRQQLAVYKRTRPRPKLPTTDRLFWAGLAVAASKDIEDGTLTDLRALLESEEFNALLNTRQGLGGDVPVRVELEN